jgi:hypothetical protein
LPTDRKGFEVMPLTSGTRTALRWAAIGLVAIAFGLFLLAAFGNISSD